jgi:Na+/H+ antiporter NhaD/arsenite permease-like protein
VATVRLTTFLLTYALIAIQQFPRMRINRPAATLLAAVAMVVVGDLPLEEACTAIDMNVIGSNASPGFPARRDPDHRPDGGVGGCC